MNKVVLCLFLLGHSLHADDDPFRERFADPALRAEALSTLTPGTQSAYFHQALDHQLAGRVAEFKSVMAEWKAAAERNLAPVAADGFEGLESRQLLLDYQKNPEAALAGMIKQLNLNFEDTRPNAAADDGNLPTRIDPALISEEAFERAAAANSETTPDRRFKNQRLLRELESVANFDETQIRWFLENLQRADLPGVVPLVNRALALDPSLSFLEQPLLKKLTAVQLTTLLGLKPELSAKESFALAYLAKLFPGAEVDFARDPAAHAAHLSRCRDFAVTLPPALASLKAHVLFHHLRLQMERGNFPKDDFLTFLALPRQGHGLLVMKDNEDRPLAALDADFTLASGCPQVSDDQPIIERYLTHFLRETDSAAAFVPFVREEPLTQIHARARMLAGENPSRWGKLLTPAAYKLLLQETRIAFAPGAPKFIPAADAAKLTLDLKNTPDLLIRIYELNLTITGADPDVTIDLDGLVPHHQRSLKFSQAPLIEHREVIDLPELTGSGVWLVDFVSGQVSARTLIRKGSLVPYVERTAAGQCVRVFDDKGTPLPTTSIVVDGVTLSADASGRILIPHAPNQAPTQGTLQAGKLAMPISLLARTDEIKLEAKFHLVREQLLADQKAVLRLRVRLTNHGCEIPLERMTQPTLVLRAELLGGVTTERVIAENLVLKPLLEVPFQVPAELLKLTLTLRGTVTPLTSGTPQHLSVEAAFEINEDLNNARIATVFFSPTAEGHQLEVRGRNGEPLLSRKLALRCHHEDFVEPMPLTVRTDGNGRVMLGRLEGIALITVESSDVAPTAYSPSQRTFRPASLLQVTAQHEIRLPLENPAATPDHVQLSLLETLNDQPLRDHFDKITLSNGELVIRGLPPGDFILKQNSTTTRIAVSSGIKKDGLLISATRLMAEFSPPSPVIQLASLENNELKIQLRGYGSGTRVSVIGQRYSFAEWNSGAGLYPFSPLLATTFLPGFYECGYLTERRLSDESRYILDRRNATKFLGVMLARPSGLLNRWTDEDLTQDTRSDQGGTEGKRTGMGASTPRAMAPSAEEEPSSGTAVVGSICDFLATSAVVKFDLTPAVDGSLTLPLADFRGSQFLEITAVDSYASDQLTLALPANEPPLRDCRLARPLDPQAHFLASRSASVLAKGAEAKIENLRDADWRAFTTLADAQQFLYAITHDERLGEFTFLTEWPDLTPEKKLELLEKHACHEFHLFLARKDKPFFERYVKPRLAEKAEPTFMDDFLLERDLTTYLRPFAWKGLNAAEKALLSQALPTAKERICRELSLRWELEAPAPDDEMKLFTQTLRRTDLTPEDRLGLAEKMEADRAPILRSLTVESPPPPAATSKSADAYVDSNTPVEAAEKLRAAAAPLFPERTKLWRESHYYHNHKATDESLIPLNRFWQDLAAWDGNAPFLSPHFNACKTNANEALMCLALLDLPFKAERPEVTREDSSLRVKAREPVLLFYKDIRRTDKLAGESPLLVRQSFSPQAEPFRILNGRQVENTTIGDFRTGVAYVSSLVITNPTGEGRRIDVLAQIPAGAIPLAGQPATLSTTHELAPYGVLMQALTFYFPAAGDFPIYPLHVAGDGSVLAKIEPRTLRVTSDPTKQDDSSWQVLASDGSNEQVLARLRNENLNTIDLVAIRWRLKDRAFFLSVAGIFRERLFYAADVSAFGFLHNDVDSLQAYFENSIAVEGLGAWLDSPLLTLRPRIHHDWQTLEFDPLINPRSHRFGSESQLTHEAARVHYQAFLDQLGWKAELDDQDQMTLSTFLFLQDRVEEALLRFAKIEPANLAGRTAYDYLHTVALFYQGNPAAACTIAEANLPTLPPGIWRERFQAIVDQTAEQAAPENEVTSPSLGLALAADGKLVVAHEGLELARLRLFSVDLEVLFSKDPFMTGENGQPAIQPNATLEVPLEQNQRETSIQLPAEMRNGNVLVSAEAANTKLLKILDSSSLKIRHLPQQRTIQILDSNNSKPLVKTYIKVFAQMNSGEILFHKDGYTDLRGKFDYISHTGIDTAEISRFAILVSDPEKGAKTAIYNR